MPRAIPTEEILVPVHPDTAARLERLENLARFLDTAIRLPGGYRIGADALVGVVPGAGDAAMGLVSAYIVLEARRLGVPGHKIARMAGNIVVDTIIGSVPLVGVIFDAAFKSNVRNIRMIHEHFGWSLRPDDKRG